MKVIIIGIIIAAAVYNLVKVTIDFIKDIKKSKDCTNIKNAAIDNK